MQLFRRANARRGYEALKQPRVDSLRLSTALGITSCLASSHDGNATLENLQFKEAHRVIKVALQRFTMGQEPLALATLVVSMRNLDAKTLARLVSLAQKE